ncbi:asparagine synthase (glutamine-hydrolysing) [Seinonella peptonophila]|uniref:asparagine synthase (glutamine-hydrolyzing) n=1 Tax=Seinonella peptonophila TaxID=112248 RepID=A0A1M4X5R6_9BACL|nr:asparagine synthase (glutamine-hydrolyzing) [Seinonella peptonophila]SHE88766.1 asparagine synthase (glutamine-hydrolysing) [Seinonella peptonophila]
MCGITGWVDFTRNISQEKDKLSRMNQTQKMRGPDAEGVWVSKHALLGHRRLIVIDPEGGLQPMIKQVGGRRYIITYNGELYNMDEIRKKLINCGYTFQTTCDTELVLAAYAEWKEECPTYLNGIFAFAIWDECREQLFFARDRLGVKPFFYIQQGSSFLFGSELKSILAHPQVEPVLDRTGVAEVLLMGPARTPGQGIFAGIQECKPGYWGCLSRAGLHMEPYWELKSQPHTDDWETTVETVRELFFDTVRRQLVSDVPIGTMLSGGLDSSAISACAAQVFSEEGRGELDTFSIEYADNEHYFQENEFQPNRDAPWVQKMVQAIQSNHHEIVLSNAELIDTLNQALSSRDHPGMTDIDASLLLFCREIKKVSTVVLSGECADEVFGGYPWFHREELIHADTFPWSRHQADRKAFISPEIKVMIEPDSYVDARYQEALSEVPRLTGEESALDERMRELFYLNLTRWMPTLLDRKDRMSMAVGLEVRVPFCDHRLVEYVWNVPWSMKAYQQREKGLLRYALRDLLPKEIVERKKSPYPKTHHPGYVQEMKSRITYLLQQKEAPLFQLIDRRQVESFMKQDVSKVHLPWFGQLMNVPQLFAYFLQLNQWLETYQVQIRL